MKRTFAVGAALMAAACNDPFSNEDVVFLRSLPSDSSEIALEVPSNEMVRTSTNGSRAGCGDVPVSMFYAQALEVSTGINGALFDFLEKVDSTTAYPPTQRTEDTRVWGPHREEGIDIVLTITRSRDYPFTHKTLTGGATLTADLYHYLLQVKLAGAPDESYVPVFGGGFFARGSALDGVGSIAINLDVIRQLDPKSSGSGIVEALYASRDGALEIFLVARTSMSFDDPFTGQETPGFEYYYRREPTGHVKFGFAGKADVEEARTLPEDYVILARWLPDGRGRADVVITGGDLPANTRIAAAECWSWLFCRTYLASTIPESLPPYGTVEECAPELREPPR